MGNQAQARWPGLKHMWANEKAVRALHVQFVPNRMLVDKHGNIVKWWNGENGKVVDGKFGKSILRCVLLSYIDLKNVADTSMIVAVIRSFPTFWF